MRNIFSFLLVLFALQGYSQVNDDFTDGDFTLNPTWTGSNASEDFVVINNRIRSNSTTASSSFYISTANSLAIKCRWEFWLNLQLSTSGANYTDVYLISDKTDLKASSINGYFVRIGNTEDEISLYKRSGSSANISKLIDGINGSVGSSNNIARIRVSRDSLGLFTLERALGANSTYLSEGSFNDLTYINTIAFGILIQQSSASFFQKHFFDDFKIEAILNDTIPPRLNALTVLDSLRLELNFTEPMDSLSVMNINNIHISNYPGQVTQVSTTASKEKYIIQLSESLETGSFSLQLNNMRDTSGNRIQAGNTLEFAYIKPYIAKLGDIIINEIFPDPSPQIDLPSTEYIELLNTSRETISLKNWKLSDQASTSNIGDINLAPQSVLILCAKNDTVEFKKFGQVLGISPWPSLNNNGDIIQLRSSSNNLIDSLPYSDQWYGTPEKKQGGWSLERMDPFSKCTGTFNWAASIDSSGGTPGRQNSVFRQDYDSLALQADSLSRNSDTTLLIYFNKHLNGKSIIKENFKIIPATGQLKEISPDKDYRYLKILFAEKFSPGQKYQLTIPEIKDCSGNTLLSSSNEFSFTMPVAVPAKAEKPDTAMLLITEVFADPSPEVGLPLVEFIEIYNPGRDTVNMKDWSINDLQTKSILKTAFLPPKQHLILCPAADTALYTAYGQTLGVSPWTLLGNNGDNLSLKSPKKRLVDTLAYSDTWYRDAAKKSGGWSLERIDYFTKCEGAFNWTASTDSTGGTPGKQNSVFISNYDSVPLRVDSLNRNSDTTILVYFNKHLNAASIVKEHFRTVPAVGQVKKINPDKNYRCLEVLFSEKFNPGQKYQLLIPEIKDCSGNILASSSEFSFSMPPAIPIKTEKPDTAIIFITEILADPSPEVGLPLAEFIEIYNPGTDTIHLEGWSINDRQTKGGIKAVSMLPKQYLILCPAADTSQYKKFGKTIGISPWPSLTNNEDQVILRSHKNRIVDSLAYTNLWYRDIQKRQGGWSLERIDAFSKCAGAFNWAASKDSTGGTPGKQNSIYMMNYDNLILKADSISRKSDSTLTIYFNKHLNSNSIRKEAFKIFPPAGQIKDINSDDDYKHLKISFNEKFSPGQTYKLQISEIKDCSGSSILASSSEFSFKMPALNPEKEESPDTSSVLITEILADPSPELGLPLVEFVELYNPGMDTIDLKGWSISDLQTKSVIKTALLLPKQYLILCPAADTALYKKFGSTLGLSPWPMLGNSGDKLVLKSSKNRIVDSLVYSDTWYKNPVKKTGGWTLEKIDLSSKLCTGFYNWTASTDSAGGTPGKANSRNTANYLSSQISIDSIRVLSNDALNITFNQIPDTNILKAHNFSVNHNIGAPQSVKISPDFLTISLFFDKNFQEGLDYKLTANSLLSCTGLLSSEKNKQISFSIPVVPDIDYPLLINEIFADPTPSKGLPETEFVEIFNPSPNTIKLKGLTFGNQASNYTFTNGEINGGAHLILCASRDSSAMKAFGHVIGLPIWPVLNNDNGSLHLKNNKGRVLQQVTYDLTWYKNTEKQKGGYSLELIDPESVCLSFQNWTASNDSLGGTPGRKNSVYTAGLDLEPLKLKEIEWIDSLKLGVSFSRPVDSLQAAISHNYSLNNGIGSPVHASFSGFNFDKVILTFQETIKRGYTYRLSAKNITDCKKNSLAAEYNSLEFTLSKVIDKNSILITEILFNPRPEGVDFVEIYNNTDYPLDLKDLSIARLVKDTINSLQKLSVKQRLLEPGTYLALTPDPENLKKEYFIKNSASLFKLAPFPSFNDTEGTAVLISEGKRIDDLTYTEKMHSPLLKITEGVSLERSKLKRPSNEPGNLRSATAASGYATPGYQNSQFSEHISEAQELSLTSKTFSPDNDGFEDLLEISYRFSKPGKIATVSIFNDKGLLVKRLLKSLSLNQEGLFVWDGLNEQNDLAPGGIYLLQAEIFDLDGHVQKINKAFVLARRFN